MWFVTLLLLGNVICYTFLTWQCDLLHFCYLAKNYRPIRKWQMWDEEMSCCKKVHWDILQWWFTINNLPNIPKFSKWHSKTTVDNWQNVGFLHFLPNISTLSKIEFVIKLLPICCLKNAFCLDKSKISSSGKDKASILWEKIGKSKPRWD